MNTTEAVLNSPNPKPPRKAPRPTPYDPQSFIVTPRHIRSAVGLSAVTIWRLRRQGTFPSPIRLTAGGRIGWRRSDLEAWLADRQQASR